MKRAIAILSALVSFIACLTIFAGCTDEGNLTVKQTFCIHKWQEKRYEAGNCLYSYDVRTFVCSRCQKEKKEKVAIPIQHDWQVLKTEYAVDCQHHDLEISECSVCKLQLSDELPTYGPHFDDGNGKCLLCGCNLDN